LWNKISVKIHLHNHADLFVKPYSL